MSEKSFSLMSEKSFSLMSEKSFSQGKSPGRIKVYLTFEWDMVSIIKKLQLDLLAITRVDA